MRLLLLALPALFATGCTFYTGDRFVASIEGRPERLSPELVDRIESAADESGSGIVASRSVVMFPTVVLLSDPRDLIMIPFIVGPVRSTVWERAGGDSPYVVTDRTNTFLDVQERVGRYAPNGAMVSSRDFTSWLTPWIYQSEKSIVYSGGEQSSEAEYCLVRGVLWESEVKDDWQDHGIFFGMIGYSVRPWGVRPRFLWFTPGW